MPVRSLAVHPMTPSTVYAGTGIGVFVSADGGEHWTAMNDGLTAVNVNHLAVAPTAPWTLYAGTTGGGVFAWDAPRFAIYLPVVMHE